MEPLGFAGRSVIRGTCPHGKILFAAVNEPSILKGFAQEMVEMIAEGFVSERVEKLVTFDGGCDDCEAARNNKPSASKTVGSGPGSPKVRRMNL